MAKKDKKIKYKIIFEDDKTYTYEECIFLYKQFFMALAQMAHEKIDESLIEKAFPPEFFKDITD